VRWRFGIFTFATGPFADAARHWRNAEAVANVRQKEPISALQQATDERTAEQRIAPLHRVGP
jgi:hypothetical protein